jgi:hypothetical protein
VVTIKKINVASAFRVGALVFALLWGVLGLFFVLLSALVPSNASFGREFGASAQDVTFISLCSVYACGIPMYGTIGGITGALWAFFYNIVARWVGGIELTLERKVMVTDQQLISMGDRALSSSDPFTKSKNSDVEDPFEGIEGRDYREP